MLDEGKMCKEKDESNVEIVMANMSTLCDFKMLSGEDTWIADTGATVHNTPHLNDIVKQGNDGRKDHATVGNGAKMESKVVGEIRGTVTDAKGNPMLKVTLKDVVHAL